MVPRCRPPTARPASSASTTCAWLTPAETAGIGKTLFSGAQAGKGRVSETASVRGLDESDLRAASDAEQPRLMESYRSSRRRPRSHRARHRPATEVAYAAEFQGQAPAGPQATQPKSASAGIARNPLGMVKPGLADAADGGEEMIGKSEQEITEQELELGR